MSRRSIPGPVPSVLALLALGFLIFVPTSAEGRIDGRGVESQCTTPVWVFFTDKGLPNESAERSAIDQARSRLTERALRRRAKVRGDDVVDLRDVPVSSRYLHAVLETGASFRVASRWLNAVSVEATHAQMTEIRSLSCVRMVRPVAGGRVEPSVDRPAELGSARPSRYLLDYGESLCQVGPMQVPELHDQGLSGAGVLVCIFDTGFRTTHNALVGVDVVAQWDFIQGDSVVDNQPGDDSSQIRHGTEMLSLIGGYEPGHLIGPAFGASYALAKTEKTYEETREDEDRWVAAIEWADSLGVDIVTSSLCYWEWYTYEDMDGNTAVTTIAGDLAVANGILVLNAAGNAGASAWHYIMPASDGDSVLCIGAVDTFGVVTDFSSRGPSYDGRVKPDLVAVGDGNFVVDIWTTDDYRRENGTSCSCPLVAGVCALLLEAHPDWTPMDIAEALKMTASNAASPDSLYGWGIPQAVAANEYQPTHVAEPPGPRAQPAAAILLCRPNPSSETMVLSLLCPSLDAPPAALEIFDVRGRRVIRVHPFDSSVDSFLYRWDGVDHLGRSVPTGVYFARVEIEGRSITRTLIRLP